MNTVLAGRFEQGLLNRWPRVCWTVACCGCGFPDVGVVHTVGSGTPFAKKLALKFAHVHTTRNFPPPPTSSRTRIVQPASIHRHTHIRPEGVAWAAMSYADTTGRTSCATRSVTEPPAWWERRRARLRSHIWVRPKPPTIPQLHPPCTTQHVPPPTLHSCAECWPWITRGARSSALWSCEGTWIRLLYGGILWYTGWWYGYTGIFSGACHLDSETWRGYLYWVP